MGAVVEFEVELVGDLYGEVGGGGGVAAGAAEKVRGGEVFDGGARGGDADGGGVGGVGAAV